MGILVYSKTQSRQADRLMSEIEEVVSKEMILICHSIQSLYVRLCQPGPPPDVTVLLAATRNDLSEILSIQELLAEIRLILLLPDKREDTVAKGHRLYPRFLSYADGDFIDVATVLKKMLSNGNGSFRPEGEAGKPLWKDALIRKGLFLH
jgi:hypothetical protein